MSKAKLAAAKEFLQEKNYLQARTILETIEGDPIADEWLKKLDTIPASFAPDQVEVAPPKKPFMTFGRAIIFAVITFLIGLFVGFSLFKSPSIQVAVVSTDTPTFTATEGPSATPTATATLTETPLPSDTPTIPPTNTNTVTATASATITNTPPPTLTETPTITPTFTLTPTPIPSETPIVGTRGNAYPIGQPGAIRDGRFQSNGLARNQSATIEAMNQFNDDPKPDEEWIIVNVTFFCDLPADKTCNTSLMQIETVGDLGTVYKEPFVVLDNNKFEGEVFGGGQKSGILAFLVKQSDTHLLIAVNDLGQRTFFRGE